MTDQEKLEFKNKYKDNPVAFIEDFGLFKLTPYQKTMVNAMMKLDQAKTFIFNPNRGMKQWLHDMRIAYSKAMEMDFEVWSKDGIEVYEKGVLIKTIKHSK